MKTDFNWNYNAVSCNVGQIRVSLTIDYWKSIGKEIFMSKSEHSFVCKNNKPLSYRMYKYIIKLFNTLFFSS